MHGLVSDYYWKQGFPIGLTGNVGTIGYKIVSDPYHKHLSIEAYREGVFDRVVYDSIFLDFRNLKPVDQIGWQKIQISEDACFIRDHHDRVIYLERYVLEQGLCRESSIFSSHGILLSISKMYYQSLGDSFNGVFLFDANNHPVMKKTYEAENGVFTNLLEENWAIEN